MNPVDSLIARKAGDRALRRRTNRAMLLWLLVAIAVHVVLIAGTSVGYIHSLITGKTEPDPNTQVKAQTPATSPSTAPSTRAATPTAPANTTAKKTESPDREIERHKDSPVVKKITETARPDELPKAPADKGLDIDDLPRR